ncbi:MAG: lipo-like protein [Burkholderiales bacterium]|nr:lipo-like protein [Burkholderiales bacterium]
MNPLARRLGGWLGAWLSRPVHVHGTSLASRPAALTAVLRPGDVLLVEGNSRVSVAIKYLTQSTWSHAALCVGNDAVGERGDVSFVEADIVDGVRRVTLAEFAGLHCRICRPVGLIPGDLQRVVDYACARIGHRYDLKNVVDLARYLIPTPPVPTRWRRRMLAFGSGDPTRAICSTLIAQAFQSIGYPILPIVESEPAGQTDCPDCVREILRVRHHSLFVPRDFDASPYFAIVKPTLLAGFDYRKLAWAEPDHASP